MTLDRILVPALRLEARVGVAETERAAPQEIVLEMEVGLDLSAAGTSDDLTKTVDYESMCALAQSLVEARSFKLIEAIAETVAGALLERYAVVEARVQVRKPAALRHRGVPFAAVEVRRRRDAL